MTIICRKLAEMEEVPETSPKDDTIVVTEAAIEVRNIVLNKFDNTVCSDHQILQELCHYNLSNSCLFNTVTYRNAKVLKDLQSSIFAASRLFSSTPISFSAPQKHL